MAVPDHSGAMLWAQVPYPMFKDAVSDACCVLDVGCGTGGNSIDIALDGKTVVGVDASFHALRLANAKKERLCLENDLFVEEIKSIAFENKDKFIGFHFLSDDEKKYMGLSPGDIAEHDCYTKRLPLKANLESRLMFVCADAFADKAVNFKFDAVICVNSIHMFESFKMGWIKSLAEYVSPKGTLFLAYAACISKYPDFVGLSDGDIDCSSHSGCRMSEILRHEGFEFDELLTKELQSPMNLHLHSFLYPGVPVWQRQYQQSVYVGRKI